MLANPLQDRYAEVLLEKISSDRYPSTTHMDMLDSVATGESLVAYIMHLLERIEEEPHPSIPMMQRVQRLITRLG